MLHLFIILCPQRRHLRQRAHHIQYRAHNRSLSNYTLIFHLLSRLTEALTGVAPNQDRAAELTTADTSAAFLAAEQDPNDHKVESTSSSILLNTSSLAQCHFNAIVDLLDILLTGIDEVDPRYNIAISCPENTRSQRGMTVSSTYYGVFDEMDCKRRAMRDETRAAVPISLECLCVFYCVLVIYSGMDIITKIQKSKSLKSTWLRYQPGSIPNKSRDD